VAELVAATCVNPGLAENKCLEVVAETTAPALSFEQLLDTIPSELSRVRDGPGVVLGPSGLRGRAYLQQQQHQ
jgi:hypothetical protein